MREDPRLYQIARRLLGGRGDLWVYINRSIQKLPGKGTDEFLHWDLPYTKMPTYDEADTGNAGKVASCCARRDRRS